MMQHTVLAVDIGSTRLKLALLDDSGSILSAVQEASPLAFAKVDPEHVLRATGEAAMRVCGSHRPDVIAITGATRSSVLTAADGAALGDLIKLDDGRGVEHQQRLQQAYQVSDATGLGAYHPLARALDVRRYEPERYSETCWVLELKDWVNLRLSGEVWCDSVAYGRIQPRAQTVEALLRTLDLKPGLMGASLDPGRLVGAVRADAPGGWERLQGVPIVECGFDAWSASFGIGCVHNGAVYNNCGTTEVFGAFATTPRQIPGVSCLPWGHGLYHLGGPCLTGLGTLAWFGERFLGDADPASVLACAALAGPDVPMCVPFVSGERMPFWRADLRASFIGVQSQHGRPEFARALIDGLLVFQRRLLRLLAASPQSVFLSGGGAALPGWAEFKASAFSVPVRLPAGDEPGLLGAAMCALVALGTFDSLGQAQQALAPAGQLVEPDPLIMQRLQALEPLLWPHFPAMPTV